jgi:hypothetical protein
MDRLLYLLPVLACPVGMGLMMWLMMRGTRHDDAKPATPRTAQDAWPAVRPLDAEERAELERLRAAATATAETPPDRRPGHHSRP